MATALIRGGKRSDPPRENSRLRGGDVLVLEGESEGLNAVFTRTPLVHASGRDEVDKEEARDELRAIEAVVRPNSVLIGRSAGGLHLAQQFGVKLLAVSRSGARSPSAWAGSRCAPATC